MAKRDLASRLNRVLTVEQPKSDDSFGGAGSGEWDFVATIYASIEDALPSRAERLATGINMAARPSRVRIRYREDITPDMRFVLGSRIMQIVSGPAELGNREAMEFMVEEYRPAGNAA